MDICSEWSIEVGITFAPKKCGSIFKNIREPTILSLYDEPLEIIDSYKYLGIIVDKSGINWKKSMDIRVAAATKKINWMCRMGMNIFKWRLNSCISIYKSFIRPSLEYGLALQIIPGDILKELQKVQVLALRRIFCCPSNVSHILLHVIPAIESMEFRNTRLNGRYLNCVLNGNKSNLPVGKLFNNKLNSGMVDGAGKSILSSFIRSNPLSDSILLNEMPDENIMKEMKSQEISQMLFTGILNGSSGCRRLDKNNYTGRRDMLLFPNNYALLSRRTVYILLQWKFNLFGTHFRRCELCQQKDNIDRDHILSCSSIDNLSVRIHIMKLLSNRMKKRRVENCAMLIDRSISYLAACDTKQDRKILNDLAKLLDFARLQSQNKIPSENEEVIDYENIQDPRIKQLWELKAFFKSKCQASRKRGVGYKI